MVTRIKAHQRDEVHYEIDCELGVAKELSDFFAFRPDGYQWNPSYKHGYWDGYIRLFQERNRVLHVGLRELLVQFAAERKYELDFTGEAPREDVSYAEIEAFAKSLNVHSRGQPIQHYDYQLEAVRIAIRDRRAILISPTASGKSLIIYTIVRYLLDNNLVEKILLVVPTVGLVQQMAGDFMDYSSHNGWRVEENVQVIMAGKEKQITKPVTISTWQSIYKMPSGWFLQFHAGLMDEAHTVKAKSLTQIMEAMKECYFKIGTTGTLDGSIVNKLVLMGLMGPIHQVTTTKAMMDAGRASDLQVVVLRFDYSETDRKSAHGLDYQSELSFLYEHAGRTRAIANLASQLDGNTISLFKIKKHGAKIFEAIRAAVGKEMDCYYIDGDIDALQRERIRKAIDAAKNSSSATSLGTFSTGINIRNLHNAIFVHPFKSVILNLQSIGRILRKSDDGRSATLYDVVDDLKFKGKDNYAIKHAAERMQAYLKEGFRVKCVTIKIPPR